ncbi:MAG: hypothetical protein JFR41_09045 [Muribaculaceae bacterium]|nr:hypothetical protein [Muribaculaceae bacterium]
MKPCVAAVGTFDGIHVGHKAIIDNVMRISGEEGLESRIITFTNHPLSVVAPTRCPLWITSRDVSQERIEEFGIGRVSYLNFTPELAALTASEFMRLLRERYAVTVLVMGYDNTFGHDRLKTHDEYIEAGRSAGIDVRFIDRAVTDEGETPSSSKVRHAIADGDIDRVLSLLDDQLVLEGTVVRGKRNGHKLGFPTLNIDMAGMQPLAEGVYAACYFPDMYDDQEDYTAVLSVGRNPTIADGNALTYELHVPGHDLGEMYGEKVRFAVGPKLRGVQKFGSLDELKKAIRKDIRQAKAIYG